MNRSETLEYLKSDGTSLERHVARALARHGHRFLTDDQIALLADAHEGRLASRDQINAENRAIAARKDTA